MKSLVGAKLCQYFTIPVVGLSWSMLKIRLEKYPGKNNFLDNCILIGLKGSCSLSLYMSIAGSYTNLTLWLTETFIQFVPIDRGLNKIKKVSYGIRCHHSPKEIEKLQHWRWALRLSTSARPDLFWRPYIAEHLPKFREWWLDTHHKSQRKLPFLFVKAHFCSNWQLFSLKIKYCIRHSCCWIFEE